MVLSRCPSCGRLSAAPIDPRSVRLCLYKERDNRVALSQLFDLTEQPLNNYARNLCKRCYLPPHVGEEAVQNAFIKVMRDPSLFECFRPALPWLRIMVRNLCFDAGRAMQRESRLTRHLQGQAGDSADNPRVYTLKGELTSPAIYEPPQMALSREAMDRVHALLNSLSPSDRSLVECRIQGLSPGQIAESLQLKYTVVTARLHRIRNRLRKRFDDECA